jgi:hypothetical protein
MKDLIIEGGRKNMDERGRTFLGERASKENV